MQTCQTCNFQFDDLEKKCPRCYPSKRDTKELHKEGWTVVTTVANDIEYELVAGLLEMGEIPVIKHIGGVDGYLKILLGVPIGGIKVMVPDDKYEEALELINTRVEDEVIEDEEEKTEESEGKEV